MSRHWFLSWVHFPTVNFLFIFICRLKFIVAQWVGLFKQWQLLLTILIGFKLVFGLLIIGNFADDFISMIGFFNFCQFFLHTLGYTMIQLIARAHAGALFLLISNNIHRLHAYIEFFFLFLSDLIELRWIQFDCWSVSP